MPTLVFEVCGRSDACSICCQNVISKPLFGVCVVREFNSPENAGAVWAI